MAEPLSKASGKYSWIVAIPIALAVLGYHPYAEDGGIYLAEIKHHLDPDLYPIGTEFVRGHLGASVFPAAIAFLVHTSRLPLEWILLLLQALSVAGLLYGVWRIACLAYIGVEARAGALLLVALAMGMPVAGTSLMLMDPYVTARSFTCALTLLSLACLLNHQRPRRTLAAVLLLGAAIALHPLMGVIGAGQALALRCLVDPQPRVRHAGLLAIATAALATAWLAQALAPPESAAYLQVAATRYYWFLARWQWFEWLGLVAPLAILAWCATRLPGSQRTLSRMAVFTGTLAVALALCFARIHAPVHAIARLQPLRCFQTLYVILLIVLGAALGDHILRRVLWRWALAILLLGGGMTLVQRATFPASNHLELPWAQPANQWEQAFLWIKANTPRDALFALDADYVHRPGEDAQGFRSLAERSALADYSKDGGQASIRPELTPAWVAGQRSQLHLTQETDQQRISALAGTGVSWLVLDRAATTTFPCPYRNPTVMVCRLPTGPYTEIR